MESIEKINAVLFDLDGTLLFTLQDLCDSLNRVLSKNGFKQKELCEVRRFVGNGVGKLVARSIDGGEENPEYEKLLSEFKSDYSLHCYDNTRPYDDIIPLLQRLHERGLKIGVVSNKYDSAVKTLCDKFFPGLTDSAAGTRDGLRPKPCPDTLMAVIRDLDTDTSHCIYVGDSEVDIALSKNAGIRCISVLWGYRDKAELIGSGATVIAEQPFDILGCL